MPIPKIEKITFTPQPHPFEEIYGTFINIVLNTGNWPAAYSVARILAAENRAYYLQFSYKKPPPEEPTKSPPPTSQIDQL